MARDAPDGLATLASTKRDINDSGAIRENQALKINFVRNRPHRLSDMPTLSSFRVYLRGFAKGYCQFVRCRSRRHDLRLVMFLYVSGGSGVNQYPRKRYARNAFARR